MPAYKAQRGPGSAMTRGCRLGQVETQQELRGVARARKPSRKPLAVDRLALWFSTSRNFDGLWVGTTESKPHPGLRRVEDALRLIKHHDPLHCSRVIRNLDRVWVCLTPSARARYDPSLGACILNERYVLLETTTLEEIACSIVHEATHARLERCGISYDEKERSRIEAACVRRELNFVAKLPHSESLREQKARTLEWCASHDDHFSNASLQQLEREGMVENLRYLETPDWFIRFSLRLLAVISGICRLIRRFAGRRPQA
jgi:hypothetical protein